MKTLFAIAAAVVAFTSAEAGENIANSQYRQVQEQWAKTDRMAHLDHVLAQAVRVPAASEGQHASTSMKNQKNRPRFGVGARSGATAE